MEYLTTDDTFKRVVMSAISARSDDMRYEERKSLAIEIRNQVAELLGAKN